MNECLLAKMTPKKRINFNGITSTQSSIQPFPIRGNPVNAFAWLDNECTALYALLKMYLKN